MKSTKPRNLKIYASKEGKTPFISWLEALDKTVRYRIKERLDRLSLGNMGDVKPVGEGVSELRLAYGSGYRIYFGEEGPAFIILLCGGDKSTQKKDIKKAHEYWRDYLLR